MTEKPQTPADPPPPLTPAQARAQLPQKKEEAMELAHRLETEVTPETYRRARSLSKDLAAETEPLVDEAMTQVKAAQHCGRPESAEVKALGEAMSAHQRRLAYILPKHEQEEVKACEAALDKTNKMEGLCQVALQEHALVGLYASAKNGEFFAEVHDCLTGDLPSGTHKNAKPKEPAPRKP